jgi:hypothetical protein
MKSNLRHRPTFAQGYGGQGGGDIMATIVNNPPAESNNGSNGMGFLIGVILLIAVVVLFFYYGLPALQNAGTPQVNVPEQVDVNVNNQ